LGLRAIFFQAAHSVPIVMQQEPLYTKTMAVRDEEQTSLKVQAALSGMILSPSGWRGVFALSGDEEDRTAEIGLGHRIIAAGAAVTFAEYLLGKVNGSSPTVLIGSDTRPTGKAMMGAMIPTLLASGCNVRYAGFVAAPEIMAWARSRGANHAFIYISASHNPIGHNGLKFGLSNGGVLSAQEAMELTESFRSLMANPDSTARLEKLIANADTAALSEVFAAESSAKREARDAYFSFAAEVAWYTQRQNDKDVADNMGIEGMLRQGIARRPLGVCCDFNGSARCVSIDRDFFGSLGIRFEAINAEPGGIVHRIVPEGESLEPCCRFLEELHGRDSAFVLGYVPDCDGDRGNVVTWDDTLGKARALEAQEVFAIACVAELAHLAWDDGGKTPLSGKPGVAVAVNDPTSLRIDRIAEAFGASVFRAEVGETNVVGLARKLREQGYTIRILGEGSAGGNITHPSAVRDPLHTVLALAKLLSLRTEGGEGQSSRPGLFEIWCKVSGQAHRYHPDFGIADIIASLPPFVTTGGYTPEALLKVRCKDHSVLKSRYQGVFLREWDRRKDELKSLYGIYGWQAIAYNGMDERKVISDFGEAGKGGLKICFLDAGGKAIAVLWMRGSATEPVFRILAEVEGTQVQAERDLIEWQRRMTIEADELSG